MNEYFSKETMLAFAGATALATLVPVAVSTLGGERVQPYLKWVAAVVAMSLALLNAAMSGAAHDPLLWVVGVANGVLIFLAAVGANTVTKDRPTSVARVIGEAPSLHERSVTRARRAWF